MAAGQNLIAALGAIQSGDPFANMDLFLQPDKFKEERAYRRYQDAVHGPTQPGTKQNRVEFQMDQWRRSANMVVSQTAGNVVGGPLGRIVGAFGVGQLGAGSEGALAGTLGVVSKLSMLTTAFSVGAQAVQAVVATLGAVNERAGELAKYSGTMSSEAARQRTKDVLSEVKQAQENGDRFASAQESYGDFSRELKEFKDSVMVAITPVLVMLVDQMTGLLMILKFLTKFADAIQVLLSPIAAAAALWARLKGKNEGPRLSLMDKIHRAEVGMVARP
jgi:hypothetical protein